MVIAQACSFFAVAAERVVVLVPSEFSWSSAHDLTHARIAVEVIGHVPFTMAVAAQRVLLQGSGQSLFPATLTGRV